MRRDYLKSIAGRVLAQDDVGNLVSNRIDGSQFVLQMDDDGVPSVFTRTADGVEQTYEMGGSGIDLSTNFSIVSPEDFPELATDQLRIQAAIDSLIITGGKVLLKAATYAITTLIVPNNIVLEGVHYAVTILSQIEGTVGDGIVSYPWIGAGNSNGGKAAFRNFQINGNLNGVYKARADITANSPTLASVDSFVGIQVGALVSGMGVVEGTKIASYNEGAGTITLDTLVTNDAAFTTTDDKIWWRLAYAVTATATEDDEVLQVTSGSTASIKAGMYLSGTNLDTDEDDLSSSTRVVSVTATTITMDRGARTTGSFAVTAYIYNNGIYFAEPFYKAGYDPDKEYRACSVSGVIVTQFSGGGCNVRPGRDQFVMDGETKLTFNYGDGLRLVASNDSKISGGCGVGSSGGNNISINSSSTFRLSNFDTYECQQPDKYFAVNLRGLRQCSIVSGDINGPVSVTGKGTDEINHGVRFESVNFKWHVSDGYPDESYPQFCKVKNANGTEFLHCYFYGDRNGDACPDRIFDIEASDVVWDNSYVATGSEPERPFKVEVYSESGSGGLRGRYFDSTNSCWIVLGGTALDAGIQYQDAATDRRVATEGGNRHINDRLVDQRIAVTSDLAAYTVRLPYQPIGSKALRVRFAVDNGSIATLGWETVRADETVDTVPSPNFDTVSQEDLPRAIYGNTTVNLWWAETTEKWECANGSGRYTPWTTVASSTSITLDADTGAKFELTLTTTNAKFENPTHMEVGEVIELRVIQGTTAGVGFASYGNKLQTQGGFASKSLSTSTGFASILVIERGSTAADKFYVDFSTPYST